MRATATVLPAHRARCGDQPEGDRGSGGARGVRSSHMGYSESRDADVMTGCPGSGSSTSISISRSTSRPIVSRSSSASGPSQPCCAGSSSRRSSVLSRSGWRSHPDPTGDHQMTACRPPAPLTRSARAGGVVIGSVAPKGLGKATVRDRRTLAPQVRTPCQNGRTSQCLGQRPCITENFECNVDGP